MYLAHELAHIVHDPSTGGLHIVIDKDEKKPHVVSADGAERRAKAFAAELLMPLVGLLDLLGTPNNTVSGEQGRRLVAKAREHFSTPWEIAANHLNNHGFISDGVREALLHQGPKVTPTGLLGTRLPGTAAPSIALSDRVRHAHREGLVTDGQVRVALKLTVDDPLPVDASADAAIDLPSG